MNHTTRGSCLCRAVEYQFSGKPYVFQYCHCSRCRKFTGSAHAANIIVNPKDFRWLKGEDQVGRYEYPGARHYATCFCKRCGSSLPWLAQSGASVVIPAGTLDEDPGVRPSQNIYWQSRATWRENVEQLPQYDELPPRPKNS